jgi:hypothetical protein
LSFETPIPADFATLVGVLEETNPAAAGRP